MQTLSRFYEAARRLGATRQHYVYPRDWIWSLYQRVLMRMALPGRYKLRRVRLKGIRQPFTVRVGTSDWYVLEDIFLNHEYAPLLEHHLESMHTIIDLGANVGFSVRLWQLAYPTAAIIAVEPDAENLNLCRRNALRHHSHKNGKPGPLQLVQACVAGSSRPVALDREGGAWRIKMQEPVNADAPVMQALTIPQILTRHDITEPVDLLKCDIEGAEAEVFADCSAWIHLMRNIVIELHDPYLPDQFLADLQSCGGNFQVYHREDRGDTSLLFLEQKSKSFS